MKQMMWAALFVTALASASWAGNIAGCTDQPGHLLDCWLYEGYNFDDMSPEPVVTVHNHYIDWTPGYVAIYEPAPYQTEISDYVVFTPGDAFLYSADVSGQFPATLNLTGLTQLGVYFESPPEPCWDCVVTFTEASITGEYLDTINIVSDPSPEPAAWVLLVSGLGFLGAGKWRKE